MALLPPIELAPLSDQEAVLAKTLGQDIAGFVNGDATLSITITRPGGESLEGTIPTFALRLLAQILNDIDRGKMVTLTPGRAELTTQQVAAVLHVSRPYVIKLLDQGAIPHRKVGKHRRVRYDDLRVYLEKQTEARKATLRKLAAYDEELGISDIGTE